MKALKILFAVLLVISISHSANILDLEEITQQQNQWCWAGCSYTILTYYGDDVTQPIIVQYAYGDSTINQWNWLTGHYDVEYQGKIYNPHGIDEILDHWNTPNTALYSSMSESAWKTEIDNGYPFVIRWGWTNGGGHFVVGQGYLDNGNYQIMDPWYGCGYTIESYSWMANAKNQGSWTHSLKTNREISVTKYSLTVVDGSGSGSYAEGASVAISANTPQAGFTFDKWTGSTSYINNVNSSLTTVTMPASNITLTATYVDTSTPIDTSKPSENLLFIAGWEDTKDDYNSTLTMDTSKAKSDTIITGEYVIASSDTANKKWPWASITAYTGNDFDSVTAIKVTYKSSYPINLILEEPELSDSGVAFYKELSSSHSYTTVYIGINGFSQPKWTSTGMKKDSPVLGSINALSFTSDLYGTSTSLEIKEVILFNYKGDPVSIGSNCGKKIVSNISMVGKKRFLLSVAQEGLYNISFYNLSGKKIYEVRKNMLTGKTLISLDELKLSNQAFIVKVTGAGRSMKKMIAAY